MIIEDEFFKNIAKRLNYYKEFADKAFEQLSDSHFHYQANPESNSIAIIIQHMAGNMLSRWTDFLTSDGEKVWRNRDAEFEDQQLSKQQLIALWEKGWRCAVDSLNTLTKDDLLKTIYIRKEPLLVADAINRQLAHAAYHVGQIVYIAKLLKNKDWINLSIPKKKA